MRKFSIVLISVFCLLFVGSNVYANTVTVELSGIDAAAVDISAFQLFFLAPGFYTPPGATLGYPVETDYNTAEFDFNVAWGASQPPIGGTPTNWSVTSSINTIILPPGDGSVQNQDLATGILGNSNSTGFPALSRLVDGTLLTASSTNTIFGVDINDLDNSFFDFLNQNITTDLVITEQWLGNNQTVTIAPVPIPGSILLLGSGILGLVGLSRRKRS